MGRLKILFVCTVNRLRSATAQKVFEIDDRFEVKSAGTSAEATVVLTPQLLEWADAIIVMEKTHRNHIRSKHPGIYKSKRIVCLYIPDEYNFMDPELVVRLKYQVEDIYQRGLLGNTL